MSKEIISLITGDGQDTLWLSKLLLSKGHKVIIGSRRSSSNSVWKYKEQGIYDNPNLSFVLMDLNEFHNVNNVIKKYSPDYIYNLGAQSFVAASWDNPLLTMQTNSLGVIYILDAIKNNNLSTKLYQAGTCLPAGTSILIKKEISRKYKGKRQQTYLGLGTKNIEDLKIGDEVLSMNIKTSKKEYCKIINMSDRIAEDMFTIYFENGNSLRLSGNHPIYIINKGWVRADELCIGDESIHKCCNSLENRKRKGKSNVDLYGKEKANKISQKSSQSQTGKECTNGLKGKKYEEVFSQEKIENIYSKRMDTWNKSEHISWNSGLTKDTSNILKATGEKISRAQLENWKDREYANRILMSQGKTISKAEKVFQTFLNSILPNEFLYNGCADYICVNGKIPDFVNIEKKKIIEYNGEYWHTPEEAEQRVEFFKDYGWETLIIWHSEFKTNPEIIENKIKTYAYNPDIEISKISKIVKELPEKVYDIEVETNHNFFANCVLVHNSEMYGKVQETPQKETTSFYPRSMYGVSKLAAHWSIVNYRESYGMFACSGILFNHESCYRGQEFVTKKISQSVVRIKKGEQQYIELGNLNAKRDWGFAGDYVLAMEMMLNLDIPQDFVIATGETHSIKEFVEKCFRYIGTNIYWEGEAENEIGFDQKGNTLVKVNKQFYRPAEVDLLLGDPSKAKDILGWKPTMTFDGLVKHMMEYELSK